MKIEEQVAQLLKTNRWNLAVAESCTGGLISHMITDLPGCSDYFDRSIVVYSNKAKEELLSVCRKTLNRYGAVSEETAVEMASGVRLKSGTDFGLSVTGIAGPTGGTIDKPIGLVYIAVSGKNKTICFKNNFSGSRKEIKQQTAEKAIEILKDFIA